MTYTIVNRYHGRRGGGGLGGTNYTYSLQIIKHLLESVIFFSFFLTPTIVIYLSKKLSVSAFDTYIHKCLKNCRTSLSLAKSGKM